MARWGLQAGGQESSPKGGDAGAETLSCECDRRTHKGEDQDKKSWGGRGGRVPKWSPGLSDSLLQGSRIQCGGGRRGEQVAGASPKAVLGLGMSPSRISVSHWSVHGAYSLSQGRLPPGRLLLTKDLVH